MATTSSVSSGTNPVVALPTANKSAANVTNKLGAGSGIDTQSLASSLVDAERAPRQAAIDKNIKKNEAVVSGMAALKFMISNLKTAFDDLKDVSDYKTMAVSNSLSTVVGAAANSTASAGSHSVLVSTLSAPQRTSGSTAFATTTTSLNGGDEMTLTLGGTAFSSGTTITVAVGKDTPQGMVDAINAADVGLSAYLINTGDASTPYKIVVSGETGADNAFTIAATDTLSGDTTSSGFDFSSTNLQSAVDAALTVDGVSITSSSNTVTDAIPGVTLTLKSTSSTAVALDINNDTTAAKAKINALVTAYNDVNALMTEVTNPASTMETYGGTLVGNSTVRTLRDQIRSLVTAQSSTAPSSDLAYLHNLGVEVDKTGKLTVNTVKLDLAMDTDFSNTVKLLSGNQEQLSEYDTTTNAGIAGDASRTLLAMLKSTGTMSKESSNATARVSKYEDDLAALDERMSRLLARYTKQFAAMDSIVGQTKSTQTGLTSSFEGLMAMYTKG